MKNLALAHSQAEILRCAAHEQICRAHSARYFAVLARLDKHAPRYGVLRMTGERQRVFETASQLIKGSLMISGILLAAGESRRMGSPKALLLYQGRTFIERSCTALLTAGVDELIVVLGARAAALRQALPTHPVLRTVENPRYFQGQLSSLMTGIGALSPQSEAAVVNLVDHPLVTAETIKALIASFRAAPLPILIAAYQGRRGHPVLFSSQVYGEILAAPLDRGAKVVVRKDPSRVREIQLDDPGILADIDTPEDYARYVEHT